MATEPQDEWHREVLSPDQRRALTVSAGILRDCAGFVAGGTALALRSATGAHATSDWFTTSELDHLAVAMAFAREPNVTVVRAEPGTIHVEIGPIPVSMIRYRYPAEAPDRIDGIPVASLRTAADMKLLAIVNRGYKRDFIDVVAILRRGTPLSAMIAWALVDLPGMTAETILRSLAWRDDADLQPEPDGISLAEWHQILVELDNAIRGVVGDRG